MRVIFLGVMVLLLFVAPIAFAEEDVIEKAPALEKRELSRLEQLEIQNIAKDVRILSLQCQQQIAAGQAELRKKLLEIREAMELDNSWEINDEGTEFRKAPPNTGVED